MFDYLINKRQVKKISRKEIAEKIGISVRTYEKYELGELSLNDAKFSTVMQICYILDIDIEELKIQLSIMYMRKISK